MPHRTWRLLLLLPVILLAGCSGSNPPSSHRVETAPPSASAPSPGRFATYAALGDSYSAGSLVPVTDVAEGCFRSDHNYPSLLAKAIGARLTDRTCGGARTWAFDRSQLPGVPPQRTALTRATDLVTVGLGGNDGGVFQTLTTRCPAVRSSDPEGHPCQDALTPGGRDLLAQRLRRTTTELTAVLRQVHRLAPKAEVLAIGYPQIVDAAHVCSKLPLARGDYAYAERVNRELTDAVRRAATASGSTYVDLWRASAGHDICSRDPWINGSTTDRARALAYHPFGVEHAAVARLVAQLLARS